MTSIDNDAIAEFVSMLSEDDKKRFQYHMGRNGHAKLGGCIATTGKLSCEERRGNELCLKICRFFNGSTWSCNSYDTDWKWKPCPCKYVLQQQLREFTKQVLALLMED